MSQFVLALLPRAGLGNKLLVWAEAQVLARRKRAEIIVLFWSYPRDYIKNNNNRLYNKYFYSNYAQTIKHISEALFNLKSTYVVSKIPHSSDYYKGLRDHRVFLANRFFAQVREEHFSALASEPRPEVALHVRLGDFRILGENENFAEVGGARTPRAYFIDIVTRLRAVAGYDISIDVFSDGSDDELRFLTELGNVHIRRTGHAIRDMILMSRAKVIFPSAGSTFSEWAGFISSAVILRHPSHIHARIRNDDATLYEGATPTSNDEWQRLWDPVLRSNLAQI